jgi:hypothetical protein
MPRLTSQEKSRLYYSASAALDRLLLGTKAVFVGVSLGVLDRETLHAIDQRYYERDRRYWDDEYNTSGLLEWEREAVERHFEACRSILVAAAGGGREVIALQRLGYDVDAFEPHDELVAAANALLQRQGLAASVRHARRDECPELSGKVYDGLIVGWGGYMLIQSRARRVDFLRAFRRQAREGSPLLLSFFNRRRHERYWRIVASSGNVLRRLRRAEPLEHGDDLVPNYVHFFSEEELAAELEAAGFRLESYVPEPYGHAIARAVAVE